MAVCMTECRDDGVLMKGATMSDLEEPLSGQKAQLNGNVR